jgi:hypothetical protein
MGEDENGYHISGKGEKDSGWEDEQAKGYFRKQFY